MKICRCKLAVPQPSSPIIGQCSSMFGIKRPKMNTFAITTDSRHPFTLALLPEHAFVIIGAIFLFGNIHSVLLVGGFAEVVAPIIKSILISVVYLLMRFCFKYGPVHQYHFTIFHPDGLVGLRASGPMCEPIPLGQPCKILFTDHCIEALSKWYQSAILTERLNDLVSDDSMGHVPIILQTQWVVSFTQ